jgi:hypothetical protein
VLPVVSSTEKHLCYYSVVYNTHRGVNVVEYPPSSPLGGRGLEEQDLMSLEKIIITKRILEKRNVAKVAVKNKCNWGLKKGILVFEE